MADDYLFLALGDACHQGLDEGTICGIPLPVFQTTFLIALLLGDSLVMLFCRSFVAFLGDRYRQVRGTTVLPFGNEKRLGVLPLPPITLLEGKPAGRRA